MLVLLLGLHRSDLALPAEKGCLVGTYTQWRTAIDAGDLRRVTFAAGDQHILIEEVIDTIKNTLNVTDLDYVSLSNSSTFKRDVWAAANQYALTPGANRMILIRDAEKLSRWDQLTTWLSRTRQLPGVYLVFVSGEADLPSHTVGGKKKLKEHVAQLKAPRGHLVRCTALSEADACAWVRRRSRLDDDMAQYLLTRTGGNLAAAAAVCAKLALFTQTAGAATIDALVSETPATDLADQLITLDKRTAMNSLTGLDDSSRLKLIAQLDSRLDLLQRMNRIHTAGRNWRDATGVNPFLLRQYMPYARHYDAGSCTRRRAALAVIDDALRNGARDAVMESLVALW